MLGCIGIVSAAYEDSEYVKQYNAKFGVDPDVLEIRGNQTTSLMYQAPDFCDNIAAMMAKYMYRNNGSTISYGYDFSGYFVVDFLKGSEVNESTIDEIYEIHEIEAQKRGIQNVGVVFKYLELVPADDEELATEEFTIVESNVEISADKSENMIENESTEVTPGFTALTLISMIIVLWKFKSK